jgi:hypothetical protein
VTAAWTPIASRARPDCAAVSHNRSRPTAQRAPDAAVPEALDRLGVGAPRRDEDLDARLALGGRLLEQGQNRVELRVDEVGKGQDERLRATMTLHFPARKYSERTCRKLAV